MWFCVLHLEYVVAVTTGYHKKCTGNTWENPLNVANRHKNSKFFSDI